MDDLTEPSQVVLLDIYVWGIRQFLVGDGVLGEFLRVAGDVASGGQNQSVVKTRRTIEIEAENRRPIDR